MAVRFARLLRIAVKSLPILGLVLAGVVTHGKEIVKEPTNAPTASDKTPLQYTVKDIDGKEKNLADYRGQVVMLVNVASKCGNTPQYAALESLYEKYKAKGFVVIGFPANNFKGQEPGSNEEIKAFCTSKYNVSFPMMEKISVKGDDIHPLYKFLTDPSTAGEFGGDIDWNFAKYLVDRNGAVIARFAAKTKPDDAKVVGAIEKALAAGK